MAQKIYDQYCAHKQGDGSIKPISLLTEFTTDEGPFTERIHKTVKLCDTEEDKLFVWAVKGIIRINDNAITDSDSQLIHDAREAIIESIFSPDHGLTPNEAERGYAS
ncbi:hypothetical protein [Legionella pneumophila]|uniref:hypothetical protein n=1 Tax=Legionella pneumophila TaxID=446 RepID=UPI0038CF3450